MPRRYHRENRLQFWEDLEKQTGIHLRLRISTSFSLLTLSFLGRESSIPFMTFEDEEILWLVDGRRNPENFNPSGQLSVPLHIDPSADVQATVFFEL